MTEVLSKVMPGVLPEVISEVLPKVQISWSNTQSIDQSNT